MKREIIKLDVGCGGRGTMYEGFWGIDVHPAPEELRNPKAAGHLWETDFLTSPLPWDVGKVDEIVCFHVIEHLESYEAGAMLLSRIYNLLREGASAYVSCPDNLLFAKHYLQIFEGTDRKKIIESEDFYRRTYPKNGKEMWPGITPLAKLANQMRNNEKHGHRTPYDFQTLCHVAIEIAKIPFENVEGLPVAHDGPPWAHQWNRRDHEILIQITKQ